VKKSSPVERLQIVLAKAERFAERDGVSGQPFAVTVGRRIARFDGQCQRHEGRFRGIERIEQVLHSR
jgi:hypothetical protein